MATKEKHKDEIAEVFSKPETITEALACGVREALLRHKQAGNPIVVWRKGKIVWLQPEEISLS